MKIIVTEPGGKNIHLHLPSRLILNRATAAVLPGILKANGIYIERRQILSLLGAIHNCRRRFPDWTLVEVHSADGEHVEIKL